MALIHPKCARVHTCIFYTLKILHSFSNYAPYMILHIFLKYVWLWRISGSYSQVMMGWFFRCLFLNHFPSTMKVNILKIVPVVIDGWGLGLLSIHSTSTLTALLPTESPLLLVASICMYLYAFRINLSIQSLGNWSPSLKSFFARKVRKTICTQAEYHLIILLILFIFCIYCSSPRTFVLYNDTNYVWHWLVHNIPI